MGQISVFGGGFFFAPFTVTQLDRWGCFCLGTGLANFGPWQQVTPNTIRARWMQVFITLPFLAGTYYIQIGLGTPGTEVLWQPNAGSIGAFRFIANVALDEPIANYVFPISLDSGQRMVIRASSDTIATIINVIICVWG
jgi:hypothetical protein